jgi:hypothetical protein
VVIFIVKLLAISVALHMSHGRVNAAIMHMTLTKEGAAPSGSKADMGLDPGEEGYPGPHKASPKRRPE